MDSHNVIYTQIAPKLEYICPSTVDSETGEPLAYQRADCTWGTEYLRLKQDIIKHGIKYPVVLAYNDAESAYHAEVGNQRIRIALELGIDNVPAVIYSADGPNDFDGIAIKAIKDIHTIFGNDIVNEPAYNCIVDALTKVAYYVEKMSHGKRP